MGGEKVLDFRQKLIAVGSPPRGRGKAHKVVIMSFETGITPAWAGKRIAHIGAGDLCRDHPRVGGEKWVDSASL